MAAQVKELKESKVAARHFRTSSGWRTLREKETETIDDERINLIILLLPVDPILGLERETADNLPALQVTTQGSGKTGSGTMKRLVGWLAKPLGLAGRLVVRRFARQGLRGPAELAGMAQLQAVEEVGAALGPIDGRCRQSSSRADLQDYGVGSAGSL